MELMDDLIRHKRQILNLEIAFYKRQQLKLKKENSQLKKQYKQLILTLNESHFSR